MGRVRQPAHVRFPYQSAYFTALVGLSKIVRVEADITHRDGSKPKSLDEILERVEEQTGKEGRAAFEKFLAKVRPTE
jgi:hypothetical protein